MRYFWVLFNTAVWTTILGLTGIIITLFESKQGRTLGYFATIWAQLILFFGGVSYSVKGLDNLNPDGSYLFAGNHASGFDILLAFAGLPFWLVSIAKIELRSIPVLGWVMRAAGHIFIDRSNHDKAMASLRKAKDTLREIPRSVLLFPEGTRTRDGSLGTFKQGGLLVGVEAGIPIVPIAFVRTFDVLEKGSWRMKTHPIELRIGNPIPSDTYSYQTRKDLARHVREEVKELLEL